ncbi:uncharacterized protein Z518_05571 [Rhinocladiella mackenziei CBS 650.93]|uniref:DUF1783-domain-containing protein n=1 Tax=Rhinocladiella mackenziei CBS 650.93 TaxID=1442369 RepID=A0A0D2INI5_9EURO|nr:uncharacterized protein Z518_05571 [Rhinocladiella mackenziei CBS 650.93]KIX04701.1 hypothetical protein Z518_05571 [Rhinocladiella mackenziei CBS 650.93]
MSGKKILTAPWSRASTIITLPISTRHSILRALLRQELSTLTPRSPSRASSTQISPDRIVRPLVPPPKEGSGPLLLRRPDRELPDVQKVNIWVKTLPIFILLIAASSLAIFNYQKSSSSTVNSILYALRTNEHARELLGDEIYFAGSVPWIRGTLNPLHGNIDINFWVKGTKATAQTRFVSIRKKGDVYFKTLEWSLKTKDGREIQLLEMEGAKDPMQQEPKM